MRGDGVARILAVDDEPAILALIENTLSLDGHTVTTIDDPAKVQTLNLARYDLILLDVLMPGQDGFELCKNIRDNTDCPILFLTAKVREADVIYGLGVGADDYIKKPFGTSELRARVLAHLRREHREKKQVMRLGNISFDLMGNQLLVLDQPVPLTKGEFGVCLFLARNHGQVFSKEKIYEEVFGFDRDSDSAVIAEHIKNIRAKLGRVGESPVETVWGVGYKWRK